MTDSFLGKELPGRSGLFPGTALGSQQRNKLPDFSGFQTELLAPCLITRGKEMPTSQGGCADAERLSWRGRGWCGLAQPPGLRPVGIFPPSPVPLFGSQSPRLL